MADQLILTPDQEQQLQAKYANKYVAMCEGKVIVEAESITDVYVKAEKVAKGRKFLVRFIPAGDAYVLDLSHPA